MAQNHADRNLLYGMLALQMNFVSRGALIAAMQAWVFDKAKPLGQILQEQGQLPPERRHSLDAMLAEHLKAHDDDPHRSLAAVAVPPDVRQDLHGLSDGEVQASLAALADPEATQAEIRSPAAPGSRYQVLRPHARGGLGEVFVALDQELHREVALKEIQEVFAADAESRGRFVQEAEITGGLEHPGIVPVYGLGTYTDGRPFYAMRFIQGETLRDAVRKLHAGAPGTTLRDHTNAANCKNLLVVRLLLQELGNVPQPHCAILPAGRQPLAILCDRDCIDSAGLRLEADEFLAGRNVAELDGPILAAPHQGSGLCRERQGINPGGLLGKRCDLLTSRPVPQ